MTNQERYRAELLKPIIRTAYRIRNSFYRTIFFANCDTGYKKDSTNIKATKDAAESKSLFDWYLTLPNDTKYGCTVII